MKLKLLAFLIAAAIFASCNEHEKADSSTKEQENIALAEKVFEHFNKHEWDKMSNLYSDTADFKDPSFGQDITRQSRKQISEKYTGMARMFPDIKDEVINIYPSGDQNVIVEFVSSGSAPDGSKWTLPICTIFTIENGMITKDFTYYDSQQ